MNPTEPESEIWMISSNQETFQSDEFFSREAAIAGGTDYFDGEPFYIGKLVPPSPPEDRFGAEGWLDDVSCQDDYSGDHAEDWDASTREQREELETEVRRVMAAWLDRHGLRPAFRNVLETERITPPAATEDQSQIGNPAS